MAEEEVDLTILPILVAEVMRKGILAEEAALVIGEMVNLVNNNLV